MSFWIGIEFVEKEVRRLDKKLPRSDETFDVATILLSAALLESFNPDRIALFTMRPRNLVHKVVARLRKSGVFGDDGKFYIDWFDSETGGIAFWLDVGIGQGLFEKKQA